MDNEPIVIPFPQEASQYMNQDGEFPPTSEIAKAVTYAKANWSKGIDDAREQRLKKEGKGDEALEPYQILERDITALASQGHPFGLWAYAIHRAGIYLSIKEIQLDPQFGNPGTVATFDHASQYWKATADLLEPELAKIQ